MGSWSEEIFKICLSAPNREPSPAARMSRETESPMVSSAKHICCDAEKFASPINCRVLFFAKIKKYYNFYKNIIIVGHNENWKYRYHLSKHMRKYMQYRKKHFSKNSKFSWG
jgi:hypothetical protein